MEAAPFLYTFIGFLSLTAALIFLGTFLSIFPALVACLIRSKESINLEDSVALAHERDIVYYILIAPSALAIAYYNLLCIDVFDNFIPELRLLITLGIIAVLDGLKAILARIMEPRSINRKMYAAIKHCFRNFAAITALTALTAIGVMQLFNCETDTIKNVTLCIAGFGYLLFLIRKLQIFAYVRDIFSSILYLCALELLPTGLLIAAAILF